MKEIGRRFLSPFRTHHAGIPQEQLVATEPGCYSLTFL
jgi:hypothetical protein